ATHRSSIHQTNVPGQPEHPRPHCVGRIVGRARSMQLQERFLKEIVSRVAASREKAHVPPKVGRQMGVEFPKRVERALLILHHQVSQRLVFTVPRQSPPSIDLPWPEIL